MITQLNYLLAYKITSDKITLELFYKNAQPKEYMWFCHQNFVYTYPEWGKKWQNNQLSQFHRIETGCNCCCKIPHRNYASYGNLFLMKSNYARRDFVLFCKSCVNWRNTKEFNAVANPNLQLQLKL